MADTGERELVLECNHVSHWFGPKKVLYEVDLDIVRGEIVSLVGPSGCGKSTLLRAIVGTHPPRRGEIRTRRFNDAAGTPVDGPGPDRGIVYQQYSLFPFLTAQENVAIGPMLDQTSLPYRFFRFFQWRKQRQRHLEEAAHLLSKLKLGGAIHQYPHQMSGGMRQRVAIAQALIMKPEILLLDEPFGALDEATREELQTMLLELYQENIAAKARGEAPPYTILIVTHELNEAVYVADRVVGLSQYWNWREAGQPEPGPGATIVYDRMAPIYQPHQVKDFEDFIRIREEIRDATFEPTNLYPPDEYLQFWEQVKAGEGQGMLA